jgi:hypothetical protein
VTRSVENPPAWPSPNAPPTVELVRKSDEKRPVTLVREADTSTAVVRGLAEYVQALPGITAFGNKYTIANVLSHWSEDENDAKYPSAVVLPEGEGTYDASSMKPYSIANREGAGGDSRVFKVSELTQKLTLDVWCNTPKERIAIAAMLEDAFNPVEWKYGFDLWLPFYHSLRAAYSVQASTYQDAADEARRRWRRVTFSLTGRVSTARVYGLPLARPQFSLDVEPSAP